MKITDQYGRSFSTLRVSLLDRCNFACVYCVEEDGQPVNKRSCSQGKNGAAPVKELILALHKKLNFGTVRLTGGEPLLFEGIEQLVYELKCAGVPAVKMTTNGFLLPQLAGRLAVAGLDELNVSLDALDEEVFRKMSGRDQCSRVLEGIDAALDAGIPLKLNAVIMKGINDSEILPLMEYAREKGIVLRFLELMKMGHLFREGADRFFSSYEILERISTTGPLMALPRKESATATYWKTAEGQEFGIIANESAPFCSDCNRLRLSSDGKIFGCLSSNEGFSIVGLNENELETELIKALGQKQPLRFTGSALSMLSIGG